MSDYNNDSTYVKNSHNINKNKSRKESDNFNFGRARGSNNINVMKSDSYNWLIGTVTVLTVLLCLGMCIVTYVLCDNKVKELESSVDLISDYVISKGVNK